MFHIARLNIRDNKLLGRLRLGWREHGRDKEQEGVRTTIDDDRDSTKPAYFDDDTRMSYEIAEQVRHLENSLPRDTGREVVPLQSVAFDETAINEAETVLFFANDFMHTNEDRTIFFIRPRTRQMLDEIGVPYRTVVPKAKTK